MLPINSSLIAMKSKIKPLVIWFPAIFNHINWFLINSFGFTPLEIPWTWEYRITCGGKKKRVNWLRDKQRKAAILQENEERWLVDWISCLETIKHKTVIRAITIIISSVVWVVQIKSATRQRRILRRIWESFIPSIETILTKLLV